MTQRSDHRSPRAGAVRAGATARTAVAAMIVLIAFAAASCTSDTTAEGPDVGLLLPESKTARYETYDHPAFRQRLTELCPDCTLQYGNANQDPARQQAQAEAMLTNGVGVLVLDPVDSVAAATIVRSATAAGVPVVSYDRLVLNEPVAFHVGFDNSRIGSLQARSLVAVMRARHPEADRLEIVMVNGAPTDDNAQQFATAARRVFDAEGIGVLHEIDVPDWSPDLAQERMEQALTLLGTARIDGVYVANDGMAAGVVAAMRTAGVAGLPPITGQDAELHAIQRILLGDQHMTVYKSLSTQARVAADIAVALLRDGDLPTNPVVHLQAGAIRVPAIILTPVEVTIDTIAQTVLADGFLDLTEVCAGRVAARCEDAGLR